MISASVGQQVRFTPRQELRDLCGTIETGQSRKDFASRKDFVCRAEFVSIRDPRNAIPPIPTRAFVLKGRFLPISLCSSESSKNL
ncbi:hypothetical protein TNCV_4954471 [Trichonephila clavipes]|nr:hypothetical protein TNCV_4954471 [Trichonephila clavipes]